MSSKKKTLPERAEEFKAYEDHLIQDLQRGFESGDDGQLIGMLRQIALLVQRAMEDTQAHFHAAMEGGNPQTTKGKKRVRLQAWGNAQDQLGERLRELDLKHWGLASLIYNAHRGDEQAISELICLCPSILDESQGQFEHIRNHILELIRLEAENFRQGKPRKMNLNNLIDGFGKTRTVKVPDYYIRFARTLFFELHKGGKMEADHLVQEYDKLRYGDKKSPLDRACYLTRKTFNEKVSFDHIFNLKMKPSLETTSPWPWDKQP